MTENKLFRFLKIPLYFVTGAIFSMPYIGGAFSPFAAGFAAACDGMLSFAAAAGSITGIFIFHSGLTAFRYFAIMLTSSAILYIALGAFKFEKENIIRILCPGLCTLAVNFVFLLSQKGSFDLLLSVIAETVLSAAAVPVFREAIKQIRDRTVFDDTSDKDKSFICFILSAAGAAAHIRTVGIAGESICCFLFFMMILFFSQAKGLYGGLITGICCSFVFAMNGEADFTSVIFSLCGCLCSFFESRKIVKALMVFACSVAGCTFGEYTNIFPIIPCALLAGVVFCFIPVKKIKSAVIPETSRQPDILSDIKSNEIAYAVSGISDCVDAVRKTLEPLTVPELKTELIRARNNVCEGCEICESCINEIKNNDNPCFEKISCALNNGDADFSSFPENFNMTCYLSDRMLSEMKKAYFIHCTNISAENKINRMQTLAGNQFRTLGGVIGQACEGAAGSYANSSRYDSTCAACLKSLGVEADNSRLCTDKAGRDYFDLSFKKPKSNFNVTELTEKLIRDTGYNLDFPTLIQNGNVYDLIFRQKEILDFNISAAVKPGAGKNVCGDYYRCFKDNFSRRTVLLSDGMGTGSRAAVDSAFTCETFSSLIKSGLDEKTAVAAVNCAMIMKSTDESLSTIDFLRLDPVLGTGEIFKCGAAPSFILHKKSVSVVETESTPIGILDNVNMSSSKFEIAPGDIILLVSDGVVSDRYGWITGELKNSRGGSPSNIAKHILQCAADRKIGKRCDDMTVIAVCVAEK